MKNNNVGRRIVSTGILLLTCLSIIKMNNNNNNNNDNNNILFANAYKITGPNSVDNNKYQNEYMKGHINDPTNNNNNNIINYNNEKNSFESDTDNHHHSKPHKDLFPLNKWDVYGLLFSALGLMIAAGGGIGGGGILVPVYCLVFGFSPKYAIPLSNITIFGSSIVNTVLNMKKRHPNANRPLVDWDLIMVMEPLTIGGALAGSFVNKILPEWLLAISLILLLGATAQKTLKKGIKMYHKETADMKAAEIESNLQKESELTTMNADINKKMEDSEKESLLTGDEDFEDPEKNKILAELNTLYQSESQTPYNQVGLLVAFFIVILTLNLLKGGGAFSPLGIQCGQFGFWFITFAMFGLVLALSLHVRNQLIEKYYLKKALGYKYVEGDIEWDETNTIKYPALCFFAGFAAGLFGVGGGIVKGPLMLEMGVHPLVASATSACMILYTSFTASSSFMVFGLLTYDYGFFLFIVGLICTFVGQVGLNYIIAKFGRISLINLSIGAVVAISCCLMGLQSLIAVVNGTSAEGGHICTN